MNCAAPIARSSRARAAWRRMSPRPSRCSVTMPWWPTSRRSSVRAAAAISACPSAAGPRMMTAPTTASAPGRLRPGERLAIIAGGGMLPVTLARHMAATRQDAVVFPIVGETAPGEEFSGLPCHPVELEEAGRIRTILKGHGITHLVLAGEIRRRPRLGALRWSLDVVRSLPMVIRALARGDDALLRCVVAVIERGGIRVTGAHEWLPDLVTPSGVLTRRKPAAADRADIAAGVAAAIAI